MLWTALSVLESLTEVCFEFDEVCSFLKTHSFLMFSFTNTI